METRAPGQPVVVETKIEPMSLPVGGKMRKGVLYRDEDETLFLFVVEETGALACWKLKIGDNGMRATSECFIVPKAILELLFFPPTVVMSKEGLVFDPKPGQIIAINKP